MIDNFDFSSTFTLRQTSTVDEFFFYFRVSSVVRLQRRKQHKYDHYVNGEQQNRVSYTTLLRASMTTSMCARFLPEKVRKFSSSLSRLESQKNQLNIEKSSATLRGDGNFFRTYLSFPPACRKLNRFIFIIIIISSHSLQSTHKREISICRFTL